MHKTVTLKLIDAIVHACKNDRVLNLVCLLAFCLALLSAFLKMQGQSLVLCESKLYIFKHFFVRGRFDLVLSYLTIKVNNCGQKSEFIIVCGVGTPISFFDKSEYFYL